LPRCWALDQEFSVLAHQVFSYFLFHSAVVFLSGTTFGDKRVRCFVSYPMSTAIDVFPLLVVVEAQCCQDLPLQSFFFCCPSFANRKKVPPFPLTVTCRAAVGVLLTPPFPVRVPQKNNPTNPRTFARRISLSLRHETSSPSHGNPFYNFFFPPVQCPPPFIPESEDFGDVDPFRRWVSFFGLFIEPGLRWFDHDPVFTFLS